MQEAVYFTGCNK